MLKKVIASLILVALLLALTLPIAAHSGRTDANGGHYDRSNGTYHYHHGKPAHQHPNGVCPYSSNNSSNSNSSSNSKESDVYWPGVIIGGGLLTILVGVIAFACISNKKK